MELADESTCVTGEEIGGITICSYQRLWTGEIDNSEG